MDGGVDIIVTSKRTANLVMVVEVRLGDLQIATDQLRHYMLRVGAPLGLVVAGGTVRLLRETYRTSGVDSIEVLAEFAAHEVESLRAPPLSGREAEADYESRVQAWLESLADPSFVEDLPDTIRELVRDQIVPVIEAGNVSAAGPRTARVAHS